MPRDMVTAMEPNRKGRTLGIAIFVIALLGIAALGVTSLLASFGGRAGGVASDPAYVGAMAYAGPTDVAGSTQVAVQKSPQGAAAVARAQTPADAGTRADASTASSQAQADQTPPNTVDSTPGPSADPTPAPVAEPSIGDWNKDSFEASSPIRDANRTMPTAKDGGTVGAVSGWFQPPKDTSAPAGANVAGVNVLLTAPERG